MHAYILGAARANRLDDESGCLAPGKLADLVALDVDPFTVPAQELSQIRAQATFVNGVAV